MIDYDLVNSFIGKPWVYLKFDCYALIKQASKEVFGVDIREHISFSKEPDVLANIDTFNEQKTKPCWVKVTIPSSGDIALFYDRKKNPVHVGLMIDSFNVLHCFGGLHIKNGKCRYDLISIVSRLYGKIEYYKYIQ